MTMTLSWPLQSIYCTVFHCICTLCNNHFYTFVKCVATIQCSTVVSQNQHTGPHWWQGENVHCRTDLTFLLYIEALHFDFLQYLHLMWKNDCNKYFCVRIFAILYTVDRKSTRLNSSHT